MRRRTLLTQVLAANLLLVVVATIAAALVANPDTDLAEDPSTGLVLAFAIAATVVVNAYMLTRRFDPLERLVDEMERADLSRPGANLRRRDDAAAPEEVQRLERARVARDLHDEVNQSLTGLLLRLEAARGNAPPELADELSETQALANQAMRELMALARQLRPTALDDLGLEAALAGHVEELDGTSGLKASFEATGAFRDLPADTQLVVYRVAQEALSNAARHSGAEHVSVRLARRGEHVELSVADDGRGFSFEQAAEGLGIAGMRERALLAGGELQIESRPELGTRVMLRI